MARRVLGILLIAMAAGQLSDVGGFVDIVGTYQLGGTAVAALLAAGLIAGELAAGAGLLAAGATYRHRAASIAIGVAAVWSLLALQAFARGLVLDNCGCFGVYLGQPLRWWVLLEDVEFVALALWVRRATTIRQGPAEPRGLPTEVTSA